MGISEREYRAILAGNPELVVADDPGAVTAAQLEKAVGKGAPVPTEHEEQVALFQWADKSVGVIEYRVVKIAVWTCERAEHGGELLARSILEPNDRSHLRHLRVMAEGHIREDAQIQIDRRQESLPRVDVQEIADERGIPPEAVGEGIVLESLLLQIEQEGSGIQVQFQVAGGGGGRSLVVSGRSCHLERGE